MIPQLEKPIEYLQNIGYAPQTAMVLLSQYYKQRAAGVSADESSCLFFEYIASGINGSKDIIEEIQSFHKRMCHKGYKPEQVAEAVESYYDKE